MGDLQQRGHRSYRISAKEGTGMMLAEEFVCKTSFALSFHSLPTACQAAEKPVVEMKGERRG